MVAYNNMSHRWERYNQWYHYLHTSIVSDLSEIESTLELVRATYENLATHEILNILFPTLFTLIRVLLCIKDVSSIYLIQH